MEPGEYAESPRREPETTETETCGGPPGLAHDAALSVSENRRIVGGPKMLGSSSVVC